MTQALRVLESSRDHPGCLRREDRAGSIIALQSLMRLLSLAAVGSLVLANPGCTLIGAGIGASIPVAKDNPGDTGLPHHASRGTHTLIGAAIGLVADAIAVGLIVNALNKPLFPDGFCICD